MAKEIDFEWSDAWILLSISGSQGESGSALVDIIAVADMLNHAIPTCTELETAITKLLKADIVSIQENRLAIRENIWRELRELQKKPGDCFPS